MIHAYPTSLFCVYIIPFVFVPRVVYADLYAVLSVGHCLKLTACHARPHTQVPLYISRGLIEHMVALIITPKLNLVVINYHCPF